MLLGPDVAQLALAAIGRIAQPAQDVKHLISARGECAVALTALQLLHGVVVEPLADEPSAAMTAIMVDKKRSIALRGIGKRWQWPGRIGIGPIVVGALPFVGLEILFQSSRDGQRAHSGKDNNNQEPFHD